MKKTNTSLAIVHMVIAAAVSNFAVGAESSVVDPAIAKAEKRLESVESSQVSLENAIDELESKLTSVTTFDTDSYRRITDLQEQAQELIEVAGSLPDEYQKVVETSKNFHAEMSGAADDFRQAAVAWRKFAEEERKESGIAEIVDDYLKTADIRDAFAKGVDTQGKQPLSFAELEGSLYYISRVRLFLRRFVAHKLPSIEAIDRQRALEEKLRLLVEKIDGFRSNLRNVSTRLGDRKEETSKLVTQLVGLTTKSQQPKTPPATSRRPASASVRKRRQVVVPNNTPSTVTKPKPSGLAAGQRWTGSGVGSGGTTFYLTLEIQSVTGNAFTGTVTHDAVGDAGGSVLEWGAISTCRGSSNQGKVVIQSQANYVPAGTRLDQTGKYEGQMIGNSMSGRYRGSTPGSRNRFALQLQENAQ
ncbi:MAG: hypothetical protein KDB27_11720 [Planctomycetales bacterium]|nr:hypothetical protein [Planctomycetales bacterium]